MLWRSMTPADLPAVKAIADRVHHAYPEDAAIFAERLALYPQGCLVASDPEGASQGYAITHPWRYGAPPKLNTLLGDIPPQVDSYFIHDLALAPSARGAGAGSSIVRQLVSQAAASGFPTVSLISVKDAVGFWRRHGFEVVDDPGLAEKLESYDEGAAFMVRRLR